MNVGGFSHQAEHLNLIFHHISAGITAITLYPTIEHPPGN